MKYRKWYFLWTEAT